MATTVINISTTILSNARAVISFDVNDEGDTLTPAPPREFECSLAEPSIQAFLNMESDPKKDTQIVIDAGTKLYSSLNRHENANPALFRTLNASVSSATRKISFHIKRGITVEAHNLPWEALHHPGGFFALDGRVPVVRVIAEKNRRPKHMRDLSGMHLKILAVIAAKNTPGLPEWRALKKSLSEWKRPITVKVFVYEEALLKEIEGGQDPRIQAEFVPGQFAELSAKIANFQPHICHFFCHGHADNGGYLELANRVTLHGGDPLSVRTGMLFKPLESAWLVILNACSGAQGDLASNSTSIANALVQQGIPVVVGMREQIPVSVVADFTHAFLSGSLQYLAKTLRQGEALPVDFSQALVDGRDAICACFGSPVTMGKRTKEWTLPVMYVSAAELWVTATADDRVATSEEFTRLAAERATFREAQRVLGDRIAPDDQIKIEKRIAEIAAAMGEAKV